MHTIHKLIEMGKETAAFIVARYCYRMGLNSITDQEYAQLEDLMKRDYAVSMRSYLERSYDDDPIPYKLLEVLHIPAPKSEPSNVFYKYLEEEKSNSIRAVRSYDEAYEFAKENEGKDIMFSLKLDGVNMKSLYYDKFYRLSLSRGRKGNSINYTQGASKVLPPMIDSDGAVKVTGECFLVPEARKYFREKYDKEKYKTSKSSAISLLRVRHETQDYQFLKFMAFSLEGVSAQSVSEMYAWLERAGFVTPPHILLVPDTSSLANFREWLQTKVFNKLYTEELPSDGIVMEVNSLSEVFEEKHQYSDRQIALKFGPWDFECLRGVIEDIVVEQQRVYKSMRIKIRPVISGDGCAAEFIDGFSPRILIDNGLCIGKEVYFERNAGAVNILIHGKRLEVMKEGAESGLC